MKIVKLIAAFYLTLIFLNVSAQTNIKDLDFLVATWKIENKLQFEYWEWTTDSQLSGYSYKLVGNEKVILETLVILESDGQILYQATVPDQNDGQTISFILNKGETEWFSFENSQHDFPTKIRYKKIGSDKMMVDVRGSDNKGFSYDLIMQ